MRKKTKLLNYLIPKKFTRQPSLKILITEKDSNPKRIIDTDFSTTPVKPHKKIEKRNLRKNSFNKLLFNQTEDINKSRTNNLSHMPTCKLFINKNLSIHKLANNLLLKKKQNNNNNKFFNSKISNYKKNVSLNQTKFSIIKKNSKNFRINTQSFISIPSNMKQNFITMNFFNTNNNNINLNKKNNDNYTNNHSLVLNKNIFEFQKDKNNKKDIPKKTKLIINKNKLKTQFGLNTNNTTKKNKKNNKKNLSTNFKKSTNDFINLIKNTKATYETGKGITPPLKEIKNALMLSNKDLYHINDGNIKLLCENVKLKKKNEELMNKINNISREFKEIKKNNNDIKEELKEKNNIINNIKLTMDIFNQELIRLQSQIRSNENNTSKFHKNMEKIKKLNIKGIEINETNEKTPSTGIGYVHDKKYTSNEKKMINSSNYMDNQNNSLSDENNISMAANLNINEEEYKKILEKNKLKKTKTNSNTINSLNLNQKKDEKICFDFNQEFLRNVDNFSESWRKEVEKMMKRKSKNEKSPTS